MSIGNSRTDREPDVDREPDNDDEASLGTDGRARPGNGQRLAQHGRGQELLAFAPTKLSTDARGQHVEPHVLSGTDRHVPSGTRPHVLSGTGIVEFLKRNNGLRRT